MQVKCEYCGNYIASSDENCQHCGAPNSQYRRTSNGQPTTIEELKQWYADHKLPPEEVTRFFIGKDYKGARAFGIFKDVNGDFVVYKNKSDGTRAERYRGDDEAFAVNELYQKLRQEISNQKAANKGSSSSSEKQAERVKKILTRVILLYFGLFLGVGILAAVFVNLKDRHDEGYYRYDNHYYYYYDNNFYEYNDEEDSWSIYNGDLTEEPEDYFVDDDVPDSVDTFKDSEAYEKAYQNYIERQSYDDDDWDSGSSWDSSDSWDSGSTDWDSDW